MLFQEKIIGNSRTGMAQWEDVGLARTAANTHNRAINSMAGRVGMAVNQGLIPRDLYQEFDRQAVEIFRSDNGDTFLNDLLPLSKSLSIGKLVHRFGRVSDSGQAQTSMSGQLGVKMDQTETIYDGSIVPIHDVGYHRDWREKDAMSSEGYDALIDDNRESVITLRAHLADNFLDGHKDQNGVFIKVDALDWQGMRNDSRVAQIDLGAGGVNFDFTGGTGADNKLNFIEIRDIMYITNTCQRDLTYYISREIASNWENKFTANYDGPTIFDELAKLIGVATIKVSSKLSGNEIMGFPLDSSVIRPMVGMGVNTVALPRPLYNSPYQFIVWGAIGYEVRVDYAGNTCAFFAQV